MARALANLALKNNDSQIFESQNSDFYNIKNITIFEKAKSLEDALKFSASGNPVGIMHPIISKDDFSHKWTQKGILTTIRWIKELKIADNFFNLCGAIFLEATQCH